MSFQPSHLSSLGDASDSEFVDVSDGTGMFRVFGTGNVQLLSGYAGVGTVWEPGQTSYNDVIFNLATFSTSNRDKMNRVMGASNVDRAIRESGQSPPPAAPPAPNAPAALPRPFTPGSGPIAGKASGASTDAPGITQHPWFWPALGLTVVVAGGAAYYWYSKKYQSAQEAVAIPTSSFDEPEEEEVEEAEVDLGPVVEPSVMEDAGEDVEYLPPAFPPPSAPLQLTGPTAEPLAIPSDEEFEE